MHVTFTPFLLSNAAVTPSPTINLPEKLPSKMVPQPQEGLFSVSNASFAPTACAICKASLAPFRNWQVTSTPSMFTTFALPSKTSAPVPPWISAGTRGTGKPPRTSGQIGNKPLVVNSSRIFGFSQFLPSKLQFIPSRHALTSFKRHRPPSFTLTVISTGF